MDKSNGYEFIASKFIKIREQANNGIGTTAFRNWAQKLSTGSAILDLGCGSGIPISKVLIEEGMLVYGIDASETLIRSFRQNLPTAHAACESVEDSLFFNRKFDAIISWGLMFLLSKDVQEKLIQKVSDALHIGGNFLFTAPNKKAAWKDILTGQTSRSLGVEKYKELLLSSGLALIEEFEDEGQNHYFNAVKVE